MNEISQEMSFFTEALRLPAAECADYLDHACARDGSLRRKVVALLKTHDQLGDFLEMPSPEGKICTSTHPVEV